MPRRLSAFAVLVAAILLGTIVAGCAPVGHPDAEGSTGSQPRVSARPERQYPTRDDGLSPSYKPDAPVRSIVGTGHVLTGSIVSSVDGAPIVGAKVELWPEYADRGHVDSARATVFTDASGLYRFVCDPPEHIHMRITADGYVGIAQNSYHPDGRSEGTFDIVLRPQ